MRLSPDYFGGRNHNAAIYCGRHPTLKANLRKDLDAVESAEEIDVDGSKGGAFEVNLRTAC